MKFYSIRVCLFNPVNHILMIYKDCLPYFRDNSSVLPPSFSSASPASFLSTYNIKSMSIYISFFTPLIWSPAIIDSTPNEPTVSHSRIISTYETNYILL